MNCNWNMPTFFKGRIINQIKIRGSKCSLKEERKNHIMRRKIAPMVRSGSTEETTQMEKNNWKQMIKQLKKIWIRFSVPILFLLLPFARRFFPGLGLGRTWFKNIGKGKGIPAISNLTQLTSSVWFKDLPNKKIHGMEKTKNVLFIFLKYFLNRLNNFLNN